MQQYPNTGDSLKKMFIAEIGAIICAVIMIIPVIGTIIGGIGAIVFLVISLIGLNNLSKDIPACKAAFILTIVNLIISILSSLLGKVPVLPSLLNIASNVVTLLIVYYVCIPVSGALDQIGASDVSRSGQTVWKWNLVCKIIVIVLAVIGLIPLLGTAIKAVGSVLVAIPTLIAAILYLIFLNKSSHAFGA